MIEQAISYLSAAIAVAFWIALWIDWNSIAKALGFGFLVYHSDSQKTFWALTKREAMEWAAASEGDASIFFNRSKDVAGILYKDSLAIEWVK